MATATQSVPRDERESWVKANIKHGIGKPFVLKAYYSQCHA
jgi:hypothetical protein